jgi:hypothetical protein
MKRFILSVLLLAASLTSSSALLRPLWPIKPSPPANLDQGGIEYVTIAPPNESRIKGNKPH